MVTQNLLKFNKTLRFAIFHAVTLRSIGVSNMSAECSHIERLLKKQRYEDAFYFCDQIRLNLGYEWNIRVYASHCIMGMFYEGKLDRLLPESQHKELTRAKYAHGYSGIPVGCVWEPYGFFAPPVSRQVPSSKKIRNSDDKSFIKISLPHKRHQ